MKLVQLTVAAFLSKSDRNNAAPLRPRSTTELHLAMAPLPSHLEVEHLLQIPTTIVPGKPSSETVRTIATSESIWSKFIRDWLHVPPAYAATAAQPPSTGDILLLNQAMDAYYKKDSNAIDLLSQVILVWKDQPTDERAALYRVRADAFMNQLQPLEAQQDYTRAIQLLTQTDDGDSMGTADPNELPAAYLGRARATRTLTSSPSKEQSLAAAKDYQVSLRLSSRDEWDTNEELEEDGAARNPYAAWEWGTSLRNAGLYREAARVHVISSQAFDDIGDKARAVISELDAGIDLAADYGGTTSLDDAKALLTKAIARTISVEGRDVALLQRVIAKEGEARIALASILWSSPGSRQIAEEQLGQACQRLEQLDQDAMERNVKESAGKGDTATKLKFSIDDQAGALDVTCSRFKNDKFLTDTLQWPASLQDKVRKLNSLQ